MSRITGLNESNTSFKWNQNVKNIKFWFSEKKSQKFGAKDLERCCSMRNMRFSKIDLNSLNDSVMCDVFLHKLTALYASAIISEDLQAIELIHHVKNWLSKRPHIIVIDPLNCVEILLMRLKTYKLLNEITKNVDLIFTPPFAQVDRGILDDNPSILEENKIVFPAVCKALHAGGSKDAHQMALVFSMDQLRNYCSSGCVVQSFINHNAVLYKIFVIGERWFLTTRPSLKNFDSGEHGAIFFNSHDVSKPECNSPLTVNDDKNINSPKADLLVFQQIVKCIREALKSDLLGIDVIIDVVTNRYGIIDVNPFPSYDNVPRVMDHIADAVRKRSDFSCDFSKTPVYHLWEDKEQKYILQNVKDFVVNQDKLNSS